LKAKKYPLRLSIREDATHSTRVLLDQTLAAYGMTLKDIESWGGSLQLNGGPGDERRMKAIADGTVDAVFDEGLVLWLNAALDSGMRPVTLEDSAFKHLTDLGWRKYTIKPGRYESLKEEHTCIDYSGWPLYTRASLPDDDAYKICDAIMARKDLIYWEDSYTGVGQLGAETDATPRDVPLHPGAEKWYREHGYTV
jgi:TRAP-type uncharacterized transport system substrate-binding protein